MNGGWIDGSTVAQGDVYYGGFQIEDMEISLPNIHYFNIDMSKMGLVNKDEVRTLKIFKAHLPSPRPPYKLGLIMSPTKTLESHCLWSIYSCH